MVGGNPVLVVRFASRNSGTFRVGSHSGVGLLDNVRSLATFGDLTLLGEVRGDPDGEEEIADAEGAGE